MYGAYPYFYMKLRTKGVNLQTMLKKKKNIFLCLFFLVYLYKSQIYKKKFVMSRIGTQLQKLLFSLKIW